MLENYELQYARHHSIPNHWIQQNERLQLAAFLEWQVYTNTITLPDARRRYVENFPDSNRLPVSRKIVDVKTNTYEYDLNYEKGSVLNMILPYWDSIREVGNVG